ncbi:hypothetical protein [Bartonella sp. HY761]|uniref:hypothetical protein n=1 Tax=Bartonella sp. HY761 TaxID=2979330 RepID=UPI0021E23367|nr:hypothetical protein [Bartonella sp. HY761]UXN07997.1 hypothetical protein N6A79_15430 [Bartonella sp. HY761]
MRNLWAIANSGKAIITNIAVFMAVITGTKTEKRNKNTIIVAKTSPLGNTTQQKYKIIMLPNVITKLSQ